MTKNLVTSWDLKSQIEALTSYHPSDKYPVPQGAKDHADYNGPPAKAIAKSITYTKQHSPHLLLV